MVTACTRESLETFSIFSYLLPVISLQLTVRRFNSLPSGKFRSFPLPFSLNFVNESDLDETINSGFDETCADLDV